MIDNTDDEIITVNIPRKDYKILREMIDRERTYSWVKNYLRSLWVWGFVGGLLALSTFSDKIFNAIRG